jgi:hypothetical protein
MYHVSVYCVAARLWRWEIRAGRVPLRCGTAPTEIAARDVVRDFVKSREMNRVGAHGEHRQIPLFLRRRT